MCVASSRGQTAAQPAVSQPGDGARRCEPPPQPASRWGRLAGASAAAASDPNTSTKILPRALASPFSMSGRTCLRLQSQQFDNCMPLGQLTPSGAQVLQRGSPRPRLTGQPSLSEDHGELTSGCPVAWASKRARSVVRTRLPSPDNMAPDLFLPLLSFFVHDGDGARLERLRNPTGNESMTQIHVRR